MYYIYVDGAHNLYAVPKGQCVHRDPLYEILCDMKMMYKILAQNNWELKKRPTQNDKSFFDP